MVEGLGYIACTTRSDLHDDVCANLPLLPYKMRRTAHLDSPVYAVYATMIYYYVPPFHLSPHELPGPRPDLFAQGV